MHSRKILVAYYSRSGFTRKIGEQLASMLECDIECIKDIQTRRGGWGYLRSLFEATFRQTALIQPNKIQPKEYDLVIIGTPIWANSVSSPIRTYLRQHRHEFKQVAFFLTQGGNSGREQVFSQMSELCGKKPLGLLAIGDIESLKEETSKSIQKFLRQLSLRPQIHPMQKTRGSAMSVTQNERRPHSNTRRQLDIPS